MPEETYTKKNYETLLLKTLGRSPKLRIIDFFLDNPLFDFTKGEVMNALGMSKRRFDKCFADIEQFGLVAVSRRGKARVYRINFKNPAVKMLNEYTNQLSLQIAEKELEKQAPKAAAR